VKVGKTLVLNVYTFNQVADHCFPSQLLNQAIPASLSSCNRFKAQRVAEQEVSTARRNMEREYVRAAEEDQRQKKEKFMHYYERYSNHLNSLEIELKLLQESQAKTKEMEKLGQALEKKVAAVRAKALLEATEEDGACAVKPEENFLEEIFRVLLNARRILSASYCIGYFIPDQERAEIQAHETLQVREILLDCDGHLMTTFVNETSGLCVGILV